MAKQPGLDFQSAKGGFGELKRRLLFVIGALIVFRIGSFIRSLVLMPLYLPNCLSNSEAPSLKCSTCSLVVLSAVLLFSHWVLCRTFRHQLLSSC